MKISQRERNLLILVGCILVGVLYYQFIYTSQKEKLEVAESNLMTVQTRHDQIMSNIATLEQRQEKIKVLTASITELTSVYYPTLIQEKIILELNEIIEETGITATFSFSPITAQSVQGLSAGQYLKPQSTLEPLVEELQGLQSSNQGIKESENAENSSTDNVSTSSATAEVLTVSITFNGSYETVKAFIDTIQSWTYNLVITNLSLSPQSESEVAGSFNLEFYGIPKLQEQDHDYLQWTLENTYGKEMPFSTGVANGAYHTSLEELMELGVRVNDLMMVVRSTTSDMPTVTVGKANDEMRESYIFSDKAEIEEVEIQLLQEGETYYYKYSLGDQYYPQDSSQGIEFSPLSSTINIQILSEERMTVSDQSGVNVKIVNQTDKVVDVEIKNDDKITPRVTIIKDGQVTITNK